MINNVPVFFSYPYVFAKFSEGFGIYALKSKITRSETYEREIVDSEPSEYYVAKAKILTNESPKILPTLSSSESLISSQVLPDIDEKLETRGFAETMKEHDHKKTKSHDLYEEKKINGRYKKNRSKVEIKKSNEKAPNLPSNVIGNFSDSEMSSNSSDSQEN